MADPTPAPAVKPGWQTSEFWLHVGAAAVVAALGFFDAGAAGAGLPAWFLPLEHMGAMAAIGWITKNYLGSRTDIKKAAFAAGADAASDPVAAANS